MSRAAWLAAVMQGSLSEIYAIDCSTLQLVEVNRAACANLQLDVAELIGKTLADVSSNLAPEILELAVRPLRAGSAQQVSLDMVLRRKDGSTYPIEFRLCAAVGATPPVFVAIGNDVSSRYDAVKALRRSEARFQAIVSNTPGLVFQFRLQSDGSMAFPYLSDGCHSLLGVSADSLRGDPAIFQKLLLPEDRTSYLDSMRVSARDVKSWNWEGRIWIEEWKDIKWINLRASPRRLSGDGVQWEGLMTNISASKLEQAEILRSHSQLAELSAHDELVKEQERTRIAREIHDDLGGNLTAIKMALALLTRRLPAANAELQEKAAYVESLVDRTIDAVHRIAGDLRPGILDFGLVAAMEWQAGEFEKQLGIPCSVSSNVEEIDLQPDQATALFRIFQEALTNIGKHAEAGSVEVQLKLTKQRLLLEIADNGKGMAPTDRLKEKSFGIRGMVERAHVLGGNLSIDAGVHGGTVVGITLPLAPADATGNE